MTISMKDYKEYKIFKGTMPLEVEKAEVELESSIAMGRMMTESMKHDEIDQWLKDAGCTQYQRQQYWRKNPPKSCAGINLDDILAEPPDPPTPGAKKEGE